MGPLLVWSWQLYEHEDLVYPNCFHHIVFHHMRQTRKLQFNLTRWTDSFTFWLKRVQKCTYRSQWRLNDYSRCCRRIQGTLFYWTCMFVIGSPFISTMIIQSPAASVCAIATVGFCLIKGLWGLVSMTTHNYSYSYSFISDMKWFLSSKEKSYDLRNISMFKISRLMVTSKG